MAGPATTRDEWLAAIRALPATHEATGLRAKQASPTFHVGAWRMAPEHQRGYRSLALQWRGAGAAPSPGGGAVPCPASDRQRGWHFRVTLHPSQLARFVAELPQPGRASAAGTTAPGAWLLTWNPRRYAWEEQAREAATVRRRGVLHGTWSCGTTRRPKPGDRVFLLRQGQEPRGIVASGTVERGAYPDAHWDPARRTQAIYVGVAWDTLLAPGEPPLAVHRLGDPALAEVHWATQGGGIGIAPDAVAALERHWAAHRRGMGLGATSGAAGQPDAVPNAVMEGALKRTMRNVYDRKSHARDACISHHGTQCSVCGMRFGDVYGPLGNGYIQVHHLRPLATRGGEHALDPVADLRPVCANCHVMLHARPEALSIEELRDLMADAQRRQGTRHGSR